MGNWTRETTCRNNITVKSDRHAVGTSTPERARAWTPTNRWQQSTVETLQLRDGLQIVLSQVQGPGCTFHHEEPEDVFGIGFHLRGGARFEMSGNTVETRPLDIWAGTGPRGSTSAFSLPAEGFRTVSLRMTPSYVRELLGVHGCRRGDVLHDLAQAAEYRATMVRLSHLDPANAQRVDAMFSTPYAGVARTLFLESCALGLLASQLDSIARQADPPRDVTGDRLLLQAREWLDAHLESPPSIVQLARIVGINDFKLKRDFKARFGTTIFGYVRQRRMERAAAHLHAGLSVTAAAEAVGYACPRYFADAFRRHFGSLPSDLSRALPVQNPSRHG